MLYESRYMMQLCASNDDSNESLRVYALTLVVAYTSKVLSFVLWVVSEHSS
jgi:hypothetical protein